MFGTPWPRLRQRGPQRHGTGDVRCRPEPVLRLRAGRDAPSHPIRFHCTQKWWRRGPPTVSPPAVIRVHQFIHFLQIQFHSIKPHSITIPSSLLSIGRSSGRVPHRTLKHFPLRFSARGATMVPHLLPFSCIRSGGEGFPPPFDRPP